MLSTRLSPGVGSADFHCRWPITVAVAVAVAALTMLPDDAAHDRAEEEQDRAEAGPEGRRAGGVDRGA